MKKNRESSRHPEVQDVVFGVAEIDGQWFIHILGIEEQPILFGPYAGGQQEALREATEVAKLVHAHISDLPLELGKPTRTEA